MFFCSSFCIVVLFSKTIEYKFVKLRQHCCRIAFVSRHTNKDLEEFSIDLIELINVLG